MNTKAAHKILVWYKPYVSPLILNLLIIQDEIEDRFLIILDKLWINYEKLCLQCLLIWDILDQFQPNTSSSTIKTVRYLSEAATFEELFWKQYFCFEHFLSLTVEKDALVGSLDRLYTEMCLKKILEIIWIKYWKWSKEGTGRK